MTWIVKNSLGKLALTTKPDGVVKIARFEHENDAHEFADEMKQLQRLALGPGDHRYTVEEE